MEVRPVSLDDLYSARFPKTLLETNRIALHPPHPIVTTNLKAIINRGYLAIADTIRVPYERTA